MNARRATSISVISVRVCTSGIFCIAFITAELTKLTRMAMMRTTTISSTSVNAKRLPLRESFRIIAVSLTSFPASGACKRPGDRTGGLTPPARPILKTPRLFAQTFQQLNQRQKERDDDGADDESQDHDHERLQQADEALHHDVDFLIVDIGDLIKHRIQIAGLLADIDHVDHHVIDQPALL